MDLKVLFLDIDGVLNSDSTTQRVHTKGYTDFIGIDPELRDLFLEWEEKQPEDFAVVLSSTWRNFDGMMDELAANDIGWISTTPKIRTQRRGEEVALWLKDTNYNVTHYAILDDIKEWFFDAQMPHLVQTDYKVGLTAKDLERVDKILSE